MDSNETDKKYNSIKIPYPQQGSYAGDDKTAKQENKSATVSVDNSLFYEIEYDSYPIKGVGKFVLKPQKIEPQEKDETKELFYAMRGISRNYRTNQRYNPFFDRRVQQENAFIFYKQGMFMKDFTDDYSETAPLSAYFPSYQMMGYEQLRTYFTWRTNVRGGIISDIPLSYAFIYIYELLNNIGVETPEDGLSKLMFFWKAFQQYNETIDKYIIRWLKDYHIYYDLPHSFKEFVEENDLSDYYPNMADTENYFDLYCTISKYNIKKSAFFTQENEKLIKDCFNFVIEKVKQVFFENGIDFDSSIFSPTKKMSPWQPFRDTLFFSWLKRADKRIVFSKNEIYLCRENKWEFSTVISAESGRLFMGYVVKQMEVQLRKLTKYKYKISADSSMVTNSVMDELKKAGLSLEKIVTSAVIEFYKEANKIIVSVDHSSLDKIRQEALSTQEKLIVEQEEDFVVPAPKEIKEEELILADDIWQNFRNSLSSVEKQAIMIILSGEMEIKQFADENSIMLEVLIDGINEKAMDFIGDNIVDEDFKVYNDYIEKIQEVALI